MLKIASQIFPDTGHHFRFIGFSSDYIKEYPDLPNFCGDQGRPWLRVTTSEGQPLPWIRARFIRRYNEGTVTYDPGILLAIESNIGRIQRGWVVHPKQPLTEKEAIAFTNSNSHWTPYAYPELSAVPKAAEPQKLALIIREDSSPSFKIEVPVELEISWLESKAHPIDVDLIIDFGNTRTAAIGLEHNQAANGRLGQICRPINFARRADESPFRHSESTYTNGDAFVDSWFVLHEPIFSNLEPTHETGDQLRTWVREIEWQNFKERSLIFSKTISRPAFETLRVPHICGQLSPALLGPEAAQILTQLHVEAGGNFFLSSPKRYLWDQDPVGHMGQTGQAFWTMYANPWHGTETLIKLSGNLLRFLDEHGTDWSLNDNGGAIPPNERVEAASRPVPNPDRPAFPRADAVTWAALSVLETAYRNIMSEGWRSSLGQPSVKRRLRSITVTFPPGWTGQELSAYQRKWQKAVDIFTLAHLSNRAPIAVGGDRPFLFMDLDEAVASQLPYVYSEINRLGNEGENWIELIGHGSGCDARARILNIDIGGGTTDVAIIEYGDEFEGPGVQLTTTLLYRDSSTIAGDVLVRRVIEAVLLPLLAQDLNSEQREAFSSLASSIKLRIAQWRKITRQVFIPIVYRWLQNAADGNHVNPRTGQAASPRDILGADTDGFPTLGELPDTRWMNYQAGLAQVQQVTNWAVCKFTEKEGEKLEIVSKAEVASHFNKV